MPFFEIWIKLSRFLEKKAEKNETFFPSYSYSHCSQFTLIQVIHRPRLENELLTDLFTIVVQSCS